MVLWLPRNLHGFIWINIAQPGGKVKGCHGMVRLTLLPHISVIMRMISSLLTAVWPLINKSNNLSMITFTCSPSRFSSSSKVQKYSSSRLIMCSQCKHSVPKTAESVRGHKLKLFRIMIPPIVRVIGPPFMAVVKKSTCRFSNECIILVIRDYLEE